MSNSLTDPFDDVCRYVCISLRRALGEVPYDIKKEATEIRMRRGKDLEVCMGRGVYYPTINAKNVQISSDDIETTFELICQSSVYSMNEDIANGFVTIPGGHRAGLCGKAVIKEKSMVGLRDISSINIRISRQIIGAADGIMSYITKNGVISNCIIVSPPGCGKTTMLCDISRQLGSRYKVAVVDERGEIASMQNGMCQKNVGRRTDVIDACPKNIAIGMLLRTMAPDVIICDELGADCDASALMEVSYCGVKVIATAHGNSINDVSSRTAVGALIREGVFETAVILSDINEIGTVKEIINLKV